MVAQGSPTYGFGLLASVPTTLEGVGASFVQERAKNPTQIAHLPRRRTTNESRCPYRWQNYTGQGVDVHVISLAC